MAESCAGGGGVGVAPAAGGCGPSAAAVGSASCSGPAEEERRHTRRLRLGAYYGLEGAAKLEEVWASSGGVGSDLDHQGFDAQQSFDALVTTGRIPDVLRRANDLDAEVRDLDGDMQMIAYENYSKFIRATDVTRQIKFTIASLDGDLGLLRGSFCRVTELQRSVEDGVFGRAERVESLLKQQGVCRKLKVLFDLPAMLQRCLDNGAYGNAVEAYCNCAPFLRQYRAISAFRTVLEDVELQMGRIRSALVMRLRSTDLSVDEAVKSSVALLDMREDGAGVAGDYLSGRTAVLRTSLDLCFPDVALAPDARGRAAEGLSAASAEPPLRTAHGLALEGAVRLATQCYLPALCDAVEGFHRLHGAAGHDGVGGISFGAAAPGGGGGNEDTLSDFVSARIEDLCDRFNQLVEHRCPGPPALVSCINSVREALRRLHSLLPRLLTKLFTAFLGRAAGTALKALFAEKSSSLVSDLAHLHRECRHLQEARRDVGMDSVLEEVTRTEQAIAAHAVDALSDCQPLFSLISADGQASQQLARGLHGQLTALFMTFADVCCSYLGRTVTVVPGSEMLLLATDRVAPVGLHEVAELDWVPLFGLSLVWIGRRLDERAVGRAWSAAVELVASTGAGTSEFVPSSGLRDAIQNAAEAVITHYVLMSGQRLAHFFRNSMRNRMWMTVPEPRDTSMVVEMVLKEVHIFDMQLARILGDPRRPRGGHQQRRMYMRSKDTMELEMERMWARKLQFFAPVPLNRSGAVLGILRIAFKALFEYVREETFGKFGLQQVQVDCALLEEVVRDFVEADDAGVLDSLLGEVVSSASQRCIEPVLMEAAGVHLLCDEKKKTFKFD